MAVGLVGLAIAARWSTLPTDGLGQDDAWVFAGAAKGGLGDLLTVSTNHPGFTSGLMVWTRVVSTSPEAGSIPVFVLGVATPALLYVGLRRLRVAWPAALVPSVVLAMASSHVQFSGRVKPYVVECFSVLVLAFAVQRLARARWSWWLVGGWVAGAVLIGTISAFMIVSTAVAAVVLAIEASAADRVRRLVALAVQGIVQLGWFVLVQSSYASDQLAEDWGGPYDGYVTLTANPVELARDVGRHLGRLGAAVVGSATVLAGVVVVVALVALAAAAWRGGRAPISRFLLGLVVVAFVASLAERIPFGPLDYAGGHRASLWLAPSVLVGLAFSFDAAYTWLSERVPTSVRPMSVGAVAVAAVIVLASIGDPPPYPDSGARTASEALETATGPDTAVVMFPLGVNPWAAEPSSEVEIVKEPESLIGFHVQPADPRTWLLYYPPWDGSVAQVDDHVQGSSRVVVYDGIAGFGDAQLPALEAALSQLGFREVSSDRYGFAELSVWER